MKSCAVSPVPEDPSDVVMAERFIRSNTKTVSPPLVPEIKLHLAEESLPLWQKTEEEIGKTNLPPPFWAFAWAGGQALARYILDHPNIVQDKSVVDLGSGSGLTAIAAKMAGARDVLAADVDPIALRATVLNAKLNNVFLRITGEDLLWAAPADFDITLVADLFYENDVAKRLLAHLEKVLGSGSGIFMGDPNRSYFPQDKCVKLAEYRVPVTRELEDAEIKRTAVWQFTG